MISDRLHVATRQNRPDKPPLRNSNSARRAEQLWTATFFICVLAVLLRLPSTVESLWVDELHSAWTIWAGLDDVAPRASAGNQLSTYFWGLWFWKGIVGASEPALRFSSVALVTLACAILALGFRCSGDWFSPGLIGAALLAVEKNSIFYGTELRPYAVVILCSSITVATLWRMLSTDRWQPRAVHLCAIAFVTVVQPATLLPFLILPLVCFLVQSPESTLRARDVLAAWLTAGVSLLVVSGAVLRLWQARGQWHSFAVPDGILDVWHIWPWLPLVIVPIAVAAITRSIARRPGAEVVDVPSSAIDASLLRFAGANLLTVVVVVLLVWLLASLELLSLWHRRYLVGCLPPLCAGSGAIWYHTYQQLSRSRWRPRLRYLAGAAVLGGSVAVLLVYQGTLLTGLPVVTRGEDWRAAVEFVEMRRQQDEPVFLAAQLIESQSLEDTPRGRQHEAQPVRSEYLRYPVAGPYPLVGARPVAPSSDAWSRAIVGSLGIADGAAGPHGEPRTAWLIARVPKSRAMAFTQLLEQYNEGIELAVYEFGNVAVIRAGAPR